MSIEASIVADSISPYGDRLTTFKLRYPKFIHGELMTHRVFSRNASSSRAVPTAKLLEEVRTDSLRASFVWWGKNEPGMSATTELEGVELTAAQYQWHQAALNAADSAEKMMSIGVHKQLVNRLLEPFSHINVIVSSTEYMNFFGLRLDKGAQPEMRHLALIMWMHYNNSQPIARMGGYGTEDVEQWHLPFVNEDDDIMPVSQAIKVSTARCARVSYESFETGKRSTVEEDLKLYDRLVGSHPVHASPAEHQAIPDVQDEEGRWRLKRLHGNFNGWLQNRKFIRGENMAPLPKDVT